MSQLNSPVFAAAGREPLPVPAIRGIPLFVLLSAAAAIRITLALRSLPDGLFDDAYITLRYSANIAAGIGFVFNPGEFVWGTTTPLFALLLSAIAVLFGPGSLEAAALTFGIAASLGFLLLNVQLLRHARVEPVIAWSFLIALALLPSFYVNAVSGMETPLVMLLMAATLAAYVRGRLFLLAFLSGLLLLTRVDAGIWLAVLAAHLLMERRLRSVTHTFACLGIFFLTILPWFAFAWSYFGGIIPQSIAGKGVSHGAFQPLDPVYVLSYFSAYFPLTRFGKFGWVILALLAALIVIGAVHVWKRYPTLRPLTTFFAAYNLFFFLSKAPLFSWYFPPAEWGFYLLAFCGIRELLFLFSFHNFRNLAPRLAFSALAVLLIAYSAARLVPLLRTAPPRPWSKVAEFIESRTAPDARIFLEHIGLVGFKTNRYIYDSMGLVTPATVAIKRAHGAHWLPVATREFSADVVLYYRNDAPELSSTDPTITWISQNYSHAATFEFISPGVDVYFLNASPRLLPVSATSAEKEK